MAVDYPDFLPKPLQQGYARDETPQFEEVSVQAGVPLKVRRTFDNPSTYQLNFTFNKSQAILFRAWFISQIDRGLKPFNIKVLNDGEIISQEVNFTEDGIPQISSTVGEYTNYTSQIRVRQINSEYSDEDYAELFQLAEMSPNGDFLKGASLLNIIVNQTLPTVEVE